MEQKLYDIMDWAGIEELTYSESADPHRMLGPHATEEGLLIQAFIPTATAITVKLTGNGKKYPMELADEAGFYAVLIPRKTVTDYTLLVTYDNGTEEEIHDPYSFGPQFTEDELKKFGAGIYYDIYEKMGAHPMTIDGVEGVYFAVWAPCAMRVSVVGDFNLWDGRRHQMRKVGEGDKTRDIKDPLSAPPEHEAAAPAKSDPTPYVKIMQLYNEICVSFSKIQKIDGARRKAVAARFKTYPNIETFETLFRKTEASSFMKGENDRNWRADFDWIMKPTNMCKVLEGKYDDKGGPDNGNEPPSGSRYKLTGFTAAE